MVPASGRSSCHGGALLGRPHAPSSEGHTVNIAILLLILALLLGGVGLFVEALQWVLIIALVLLVLSAVTGRRARL